MKQYVVRLSWQFDTHVKESRNFTVADKFLNGSELKWRLSAECLGETLRRRYLQRPT